MTWTWNRAHAQARSQLTRRRLLAGIPVATTSGVLMAACSPGTGAGPQGAAAPQAQIKPGATIAWAIDEGATRSVLRDDQIKLFHEKFPTIKIEKIAGATGTEKLQTLFAAGTPPDMFRQETSGMAFFASRGQVTALDPYLKRDRYDLSDFFPTAWELWKWKNKYYGVPFLGIRILYFNRSLTQQVGTRVPATWRDATWTFEAFLDACRKVTVRSGNSATRWGSDLGTSRRDWQPWVWNNGGELFSLDGTRLLFTEPAAVEAVQFLADLIHRHRVAPTSTELRDQGGRAGLFQAGNLLFFHAATQQVAANRRTIGFDWSLSGLPKGKGRTVSSSGGGVGWFIANESKVKDETWELAKVLASKEGVRMEAVRGEAPPSRRSVANEPEFINPPEPPKGDMKVIVEALEVMKVETALIEGVEIDRILDEELGFVWRGEKTARDALNAAATRIRPLLNPAG